MNICERHFSLFFHEKVRKTRIFATSKLYNYGYRHQRHFARPF
nr:MAG TPA: hypothetical protein [Caudoviricetes sp.]